ncbi:MAG TPA: hypothetical protein PJ982_15950 [Lacipirellulaceae bacterium]|nr:hypothetical protein [Lacipirellulaceae bacterium]
MNTIDVTGVPSPIVDAVQAMVDRIRRAQGGSGAASERDASRPLSLWSGGVRGELTREEIYEDVDGCSIDDR